MIKKHSLDHSFTVRELEIFDPELEEYTFPYWRQLFRSLGKEIEEKHSPFALTAMSGDGEKVGLLLGGLVGERQRRAVFLSVYVVPHWRGQGVGRALWAAAEEVAGKAGAEIMKVTYLLGKPSIPFLEKILERQEWSDPQLNMYVVGIDVKNIRNAPWMRKCRLPEDYEIILWRDLPQTAIDELIASDAEKPWIPPDLRPMDFFEHCHEESSLALKRQGKVRGWLITHLLNGVPRLSCGFVHPDLQRRGRMFALYAEAARRVEPLGLEEITATVPARHVGMAAFAQRWLKPFSQRFTESRLAVKKLREE
ncbi:MAG: GNAT family N-acetyltransferase [Opitutales bacterium]|nr:GNAT family N-acetyltransferase [Opitutales bacterium]